jgi:hypothetical protein
VARSIKIITDRPSAIPDSVGFQYEVLQLGPGDWDKDPPDPIVVYGVVDLPSMIELSDEQSIHVLLSSPQELADASIRRAVDVAAEHHVELTFRVQAHGGSEA